jgi:hypothetical protein
VIPDPNKIELEGVIALYTDEFDFHPADGKVTWFKDELGTVWVKFNSPEEDARTTCIPQLYVRRVDLE